MVVLLQRRDTEQMIIKMRSVTVHEVPETVKAATERKFLRDLQNYVETERPRLVLDCSRVRQMDNATIHLLLSCLEEAMKRNGDVKLAGVRPDAKATLAFAGVSRLFEIYATTAEATQSFRHRSHAALLSAFDDTELELKAESVA
jgi:anti-anti-sigma factor